MWSLPGRGSSCLDDSVLTSVTDRGHLLVDPYTAEDVLYKCEYLAAMLGAPHGTDTWL
jgi:hypothetical protein